MKTQIIYLGVVALPLLTGCVTQQRISYQQDVMPILETKCISCHLPPNGEGYLRSQLNMNSYESIMEGAIYGPVVVPGDSQHSVLNMLVEGRLDASMRTPHPLTEEEIEILRRWVDQGARNN